MNNLRDPGYQAGLANVLKMIEKGALSEDDFKDVIAAYKDDALSMKSIRMALGENRTVPYSPSIFHCLGKISWKYLNSYGRMLQNLFVLSVSIIIMLP